jgi:hypothetical protein
MRRLKLVAKYIILTSICLNQAVMWFFFGIPILSLFYLIMLPTFVRRLLDEGVGLAFDIAEKLGWQ